MARSMLRWSFVWMAVILAGCQAAPAARSGVQGRFFIAAVNPTHGLEETRLYVMPANGTGRAMKITDYTGVAGMIAYPAKQAIGIINEMVPAGSYLIDIRAGSAFGSTPTMRPMVMMTSVDPHYLTQTVFSPDGKRLAGISSDDRMCIVDAGVQTGAPVCAADKLPCTRQIVSWSPDGKTIAFSASLASSRIRCDLSEIFLMDVQTGAVRQLTNIPGDAMEPAQRKMYLVAGDPTDHWHNSGHAAWSPDGQWIAFNMYLGVALIRPDGTDFRVLARGLHPAWSPDGRFIAYLVARQSPFDRRKYPTTFDMPWDIHVVRPEGRGDVSVSDSALVAEDGSTLLIQQFVWAQ